MTGLEGVFAGAVEVEAFCRARGWSFCFIGGIAVQRWGTPRFTQDVDVTLLTGFGGEEAFVDVRVTFVPDVPLRSGRDPQFVELAIRSIDWRTA